MGFEEATLIHLVIESEIWMHFQKLEGMVIHLEMEVVMMIHSLMEIWMHLGKEEVMVIHLEMEVEMVRHSLMEI